MGDPAALFRAARAVMRLTQSKFGEALGMDKQRVSLIERGRLRDLRVSEAKRVKQMLGIEIELWG